MFERSLKKQTTQIHDLFTKGFQSKIDCVLSNYDSMYLSRLPPYKNTLRVHVLRANYQARIWNTAHEA